MLQYAYPHGPVTHICPVAHNSHNTRLDSLMVVYTCLRVCVRARARLELLKRRVTSIYDKPANAAIFNIHFSFRAFLLNAAICMDICNTANRYEISKSAGTDIGGTQPLTLYLFTDILM